MKTNDVVLKTGISKQTIMYYEKEGLLTPQRDNNDYRNYNDEDIQILMLIKLLRSMNVSIDDIKLVLNNELSFQACLKMQQSFVAQTLKDIKEVKSTIDFYKEKNIPMIPALNEIDKIDDKSILGFQKTTPNVTIGRKLTKKYLIRKILMQIIISLMLALACYHGYKKVTNNDSGLIIIIGFIFFTFIQIIAYGLGAGEMGLLSIQNNAAKFVEFDETGINFLEERFSKRIAYAFKLLQGKASLKHLDYSDIQDVVSKHVTRYMKIPGSNLQSNIDTIDYYFTFKDGSTYTIINPMLLDNDRELLEIIINEKIKQ